MDIAAGPHSSGSAPWARFGGLSELEGDLAGVGVTFHRPALQRGELRAPSLRGELMESRWAGADLRSLVAQELSPYSQEGDGQARFEGPQLMMEPDTAQAIGQ
jgi:HWE histidine kinase